MVKSKNLMVTNPNISWINSVPPAAPCCLHLLDRLRCDIASESGRLQRLQGDDTQECPGGTNQLGLPNGIISFWERWAGLVCYPIITYWLVNIVGDGLSLFINEPMGQGCRNYYYPLGYEWTHLHLPTIVIMNSRTFQVIQLYEAPVVLHIREDCQWSQWILSATKAFDGAKSCPMHIVIGPEPVVEITHVSRKFT